MSKHDWDENDTTGYFLSEDSQARLRKLHEHMVFLSQLAQPRSADEEPSGWGPQIVGSELAVCMELLAEQAEWVLDAVSWPAERRARKTPGEVAAEREQGEAQEDFAFGITLEQIEALNRLVDSLSADGEASTGSGEAIAAEAAQSAVESAMHDGLDALREILAQVQVQPLGGSRVGETRAVYGASPMRPATPGLRGLPFPASYSAERLEHPAGARWH